MATHTPDTSVLPKNLRRLMAEKGITYRMLEQKAGITQSSIARILSGTTTPRASTVINLASALGVSPDVLFIENKPGLFSAEELLTSKETDLRKTIKNNEIRMAVIPLIKIEFITEFLKGEYESEQFVPLPPGNSTIGAENLFAMEIGSCDMSPSLLEGDTVYFEYNDDFPVSTTDIVLAYAEGKEDPIIGRLLKLAAAGNRLTFDNEQFNLPDIGVANIVAKAVGLYRPVREGF